MLIVRVTLLFLALFTTVWATSTPMNTSKIDIELFVSSTCPHCKKAEAYMQDLALKMPGIHVQVYVINEDKNALEVFSKRLKVAGLYDFSVPAFFFCNTHWQGFDANNTTGGALLNAIQYCEAHTNQEGVTALTSTTLQGYVQATYMEAQLKGSNTTRSMIVLLAMMDALNPCALFLWCAVFAGLFFENTKRGVLKVALSFIVSIMMLHYAQQAFPEIYELIKSWCRLPAVFLSALMLYQLIQKQKIHLGLKLLFIALIFMYQQSCQAIWSLGNQLWLLQKELPWSEQALYQLLYQCIYVLPLLLACFVYYLLSRSKRFCEIQLQLSKVGSYSFGSLALLLLAYPKGLSHYGGSVIFLLINVFFLWVFIRKRTTSVTN